MDAREQDSTDSGQCLTRIADITHTHQFRIQESFDQEVTMITIGGKDYDQQELAREIELEILLLDAQIKGLREWRESRIELIRWLRVYQCTTAGYFPDVGL